MYRGQGIYMEELKRCLSDQGLNIAIIGIHQRWNKKLQKDLEALIAGPPEL